MSDRRLAVAVLLFLLAAYTLSYSGVFHSDDEMSVAAAAESLAKRGSMAIDQLRWNQDLSGGIGKYGLDGHLYSKYGWGASVRRLPFYLAALALPDLGAVQAAMLLNLLVTALTGALVFLCARRLGVRQGGRRGGGPDLRAGHAWPGPMPSTSSASRCRGWRCWRHSTSSCVYRDDRRGCPVAGRADPGGALAVKTANAAAIPLFFLLLAVYEWQPGGRGQAGTASSAYARGCCGAPCRWPRPSCWPAGSRWPTTGCASAPRWTPATCPSSSSRAGCRRAWPGLLLSPGRGLLFYAPVFLLLIPALPGFWRARRAEAAVIVLLAVSQTLLYARWHVWFGGWCWGPRFLVPLMPFLALALGHWLQDAWRRGRGVRWTVLGLAAVSALVQVLGLSVDFNVYLRSLLALRPEMRAGIAYLTVDDPRFSPLLGPAGPAEPG